MAWYGTQPGVTRLAVPMQIAYWGIFLLALLSAVYVALLDLRYIRLQYTLGERELYNDTLGAEELRTALSDNREKPAPTETASDGS